MRNTGVMLFWFAEFRHRNQQRKSLGRIYKPDFHAPFVFYFSKSFNGQSELALLSNSEDAFQTVIHLSLPFICQHCIFIPSFANLYTCIQAGVHKRMTHAAR
jgi:hypothetical protein